jgi:hypothetical protein
MKELIKDYKRRLKTVEKAFDDERMAINKDLCKLARLNTKASEYRTFIAELEKEYNKGITVEDIYCIQIWYGEHISHVYLNKEQAENAANTAQALWKAARRAIHNEMSDEEFEVYYRENFKSFTYKVQSLDDCIGDVVDNAIFES